MQKCDWRGLESQRVAVRLVAWKALTSSRAAEKWCQTHQLNCDQLLAAGVRDPDSVKQYPVVAEAAKGQRELVNLMWTLQENHSLYMGVIESECREVFRQPDQTAWARPATHSGRSAVWGRQDDSYHSKRFAAEA